MDSVSLGMPGETGYGVSVAGGKYSETYFRNRPQEKDNPGVLYLMKLNNPETGEKFVKVGIAKARKGKTGKGTLQRGVSGDNYSQDYRQVRVREWFGTIYECWKYEQELHEKYKAESYKPSSKFGGHTECFNYESLIKINQDFPKNNS
mgnify:CR=1 FL=1|jgi:hypothetical protein|tara:strand:- start:1530 stop:1973 length:444 start_codon:yes stop_codon:yes gene_type:complete